jgi:hypothetical protein
MGTELFNLTQFRINLYEKTTRAEKTHFVVKK